MKVLATAFALDDKILALSLALARLYTKTQATWMLYVYAPLTLTVSHDSLSSLVRQRLACTLDVGCKIIRVCEV